MTQTDPSQRLKFTKKLSKRVKCTNTWGRRFTNRTLRKQLSLTTNLKIWWVNWSLEIVTATWKTKQPTLIMSLISWPMNSRTRKEWCPIRLLKRTKNILTKWRGKSINSWILWWRIVVILKISEIGQETPMKKVNSYLKMRMNLMMYNYPQGKTMRNRSKMLRMTMKISRFQSLKVNRVF